MLDNINLFCRILIEKYKISYSLAFNKLHAEYYIMVDARNLRIGDDYIQKMILYGKSCDQTE